MKTVKLATILEGGVLSSPYDSGNFSISFSTCSEIKDGAVKMLTGFYHIVEPGMWSTDLYINRLDYNATARKVGPSSSKSR